MKNSIYFQMAEKRESIVSVTKNPNESVASQNVISSGLSAKTSLRNHSNIIFRHLRSINIFRNTLCKIRKIHDINKLQEILYQYINEFVKNLLL